MEYFLIILLAFLACLVGWLAHRIEKWNRERSSIGRQNDYRTSGEGDYSGDAHTVEPTRSIISPISPEVQLNPSASVLAEKLAPTVYLPTCIETRFENWRSDENKYPPDWKFRTAAVRLRDDDMCQVAGCPCLGITHVHHLESIKDRGNHALSNLITLCEFHHALMPDHLEAIGESLESNRFSVRRGHMREGYYVRPAITRRIPANDVSILELITSYKWACRKCDQRGFDCESRQEPGWPEINSGGNKRTYSKRLICQNCGHAWYLQRALLEEVGLVLAHIFGQPSHPKLIEYEKNWLEAFDYMPAQPCPRHDCLGHLVWRQNQTDRSIFQGCSQWHETNCRGR